MKITSLAFIQSYLNTAEILERVSSCILSNGKQAAQPRKWHKHLPCVPEYLVQTPDIDETLWILIRYEGAYECLSMTSQNLCTEIVKVPLGIQRAIKVELRYNEGVKWCLYQNKASDVKHKDVKQCIRTFKI